MATPMGRASRSDAWHGLTARRILPCMTEAHRTRAYPPAMPSDAWSTPTPTPARRPVHPGRRHARCPALALGIDVGGTGVKAALVDLATARAGRRRGCARRRPSRPRPRRSPQTIASRRGQGARWARSMPADLPVGCGLPGVVKDGRLQDRREHRRGLGRLAREERIGEAIGRKVLIINDADAAGVAELAYGAAEGQPGTVLLLTLGTGIGSALFLDGHLVPNTEFGHLEMHGRDAETLVSRRGARAAQAGLEALDARVQRLPRARRALLLARTSSSTAAA